MKPLRRILLLALAATIALIAAGLPAQTTRALERAVRQSVTKAAVQLGPIAIVTEGKQKELRYMGWGSGTIVAANGYILTNYHVADVSELKAETEAQSKNVEVIEGMLVVMLTKRTDQPPVAAYLAEVVTASPELDLAVLRISHDLSGDEVDAETLKLPFVPLGDSDSLEVGDTLNIFGYPGIGGETITFTSGPVSGFVNEDGIDRAWIKTSATIAGGNSGGTGVDEAGALVGVPTRGGAGSNDQTVDCRPVADTNGDGELDENDSCVPIGGFLNSLRPVNVAKPLIAEAQGGEPAPGPDESGVLISGTIVDAGTGKPIPNALFLVLKPGITWEATSGEEEDILEAVYTDRKGVFQMTVPLKRGQPYSIGVGAKGYKPLAEDDVVLEADTPDEIEITLELQKK